MARTKRKRRPVVRPDAKIAASPGTLTVHPDAPPSRVSVLAYGPDDLVEEELEDLSRLEELKKSHAVVWVDVVGLGTLETLTGLADRFGLHHLALEDVLNIPQRPKIDEYEDHEFLVARMPVTDGSLDTEQLSVFLGKGFVITFQERPGDCFEGIRSRLRSGRARIRGGGSDYLLYAILDALVDSWFPLLEHVGERLDHLEDRIHENPEKHHIEEIYALRRELVTLRRYLGPLRDLNAALLRPDHPFLSEKTRVYMRDCHDHSVTALALVESYREITGGLMELYLSVVSHRMNEVMKVLTIIATVFIPLSFIAGLYGMNFDPEVSRWNMPELGWAWGYRFALGLMVLCGTGMLFVFWRKGWFR